MKEYSPKREPSRGGTIHLSGSLVTYQCKEHEGVWGGNPDFGNVFPAFHVRIA